MSHKMLCNKDQIEGVTFNSLSEIPGWIDAHPREMLCRDSETYSSSLSWDRNTNYDAALEIVKRGGLWEEGGKALKEATLKMADLKVQGRVPALDNDVCGFMPDVPAFLSGDPCSMWNESESEVEQSPIITVGVSLGQSCGVTSGQAVNYGAAIMSVVDELENKGVRVELWGCYANSESSGGCDFRVLLKSADEHWSPNSVAFALCHSAMNRRIMFRVVESFGSLTRFAVSCGRGYDLYGEFDVWFHYLLGSESEWSRDPESAMKYVSGLAQGQLDNRKEAA